MVFNDTFFKKNITFTSSNSVLNICNRFFSDYNFNYFDYVRAYNDNKCLVLTSDARWCEKYYRDKYPLGPTLQNNGIHLWENYCSEGMVKAAIEHSNHAYGISIIKKHNNYCECVNFSASKDISGVLDFYFNNLDILYKFIFYFKDRAMSLITKAEKEKYTFPVSVHSQLNKNEIIGGNQLKTLFSPKRYYLDTEKGNVFLTKREAQCIAHAIHRMPVKSIANLLDISPRTVETHIESVKIKLGCNTLPALVQTILTKYPEILRCEF